jgi:hypothetical protein
MSNHGRNRPRQPSEAPALVAEIAELKGRMPKLKMDNAEVPVPIKHLERQEKGERLPPTFIQGGWPRGKTFLNKKFPRRPQVLTVGFRGQYLGPRSGRLRFW